MKKSIMFLALSLLVLIQIQAQTTFALANDNASMTTDAPAEKALITEDIETIKFKKVEKEVIKKLQSEMEFPEVAYQYGIEGTVYLQFTFDGEIKDLKVVQSVGAGCDKAAINAVQNFPKLYKELGGETIQPIQITVPFKFEM